MEDFEARNARDWDDDTVISEPLTKSRQITHGITASSNTTNARSRTGNGFQHGVSRTTFLLDVADSRVPTQTRVSYSDNQRQGHQISSIQGHAQPRGSGCHKTSSSASANVPALRGSSHGRGRADSFRRTDARSTPRPNLGRGNYQSGRQPYTCPPGPKVKWAAAKGLVTTRRAKDRDERAMRAADVKSFLKAPSDNESCPVICYYMWPSRNVQPSDLLGLRLEKLDPIRIQYRVHIEEMIGEECLKISCPEFHFQAERWLDEIVEGIRAAVKHEKTNASVARPVYVVTPPNPEAMRTSVQASRIELVEMKCLGAAEPKKVWKAFELKLAGDYLPDEELQVWKNSEQQALASANLRLIEDHLSKSFMSLACHKGLMRMRVHFGRVILTKSKPAFKAGTMNFKNFATMMNKSGMETEFVEEIGDATIALRLKGLIVQSPEEFRPVPASIYTLEDVHFRETAIVVVKNKDGEQFRIEADLDRHLENMSGQYQVGATRHFKSNDNLRMKVETLDLESQVDYTLKIVSYDAVHGVQKDLLNVTKDLVSTRPRIRQDALGLDFPNIIPLHTEGLDIISVIVRSTVRYMLKNSSCIVEISIDRQWPNMNTSTAPDTVAGVSMYNQQWDWQMRSFETSPNERVWSSDLSDFFEDNEHNLGRIAKFIADVEMVKNLLADATHSEVYEAFADEEQPDIYSADD